MGSDWCRMWLKTDNLDEIIKAVHMDSQARAIHRKTYEHVNPFAHHDGKATEVALEHLKFTSDVLLKHLDVEVLRETYLPNQTTGKSKPAIRASTFTQNHVFPSEWREQARRTFLPDELPKYVEQWNNHLREIRQGYHIGYLLDWYLSEQSYLLLNIWMQLTRAASEAHERTNSWALHLKETDILERILDEKVKPDTFAQPQWKSAELHKTNVDYGADDRYVYVQMKTNELKTLIREWNRRVPSNQKVQLHRYDFEEFLSWAESGDLDELMDWLQHCTTLKAGMYYWGF